MFFVLDYDVGTAASEKTMPTSCYPDSTPMMLTMGLLVPVTRKLV